MNSNTTSLKTMHHKSELIFQKVMARPDHPFGLGIKTFAQMIEWFSTDPGYPAMPALNQDMNLAKNLGLKPGDVVERYSDAGYSHMGIYLGRGLVMDYRCPGNRKPNVFLAISPVSTFNTLNLFLFKRAIKVGMWKKKMLFSANRKKILYRALEAYAEQKPFTVFNNCQSFVNGCVLGIPVSTFSMAGVLTLSLYPVMWAIFFNTGFFFYTVIWNNKASRSALPHKQ